MSHIELVCPRCGAKGHVPEETLGRRIKCPKCQERFAATRPENPPPAAAAAPAPSKTADLLFNTMDSSVELEPLVEVACPKCGDRSTSPAWKVGMPMTCAVCGRLAILEPVARTFAPPAAARSASSAPARRPVARRSLAAGGEAEPSSRNPGIWIAVGLVVAAVVLVGVWILYLELKERQAKRDIARAEARRKAEADAAADRARQAERERLERGVARQREERERMRRQKEAWEAEEQARRVSEAQEEVESIDRARREWEAQQRAEVRREMIETASLAAQEVGAQARRLVEEALERDRLAELEEERAKRRGKPKPECTACGGKGLLACRECPSCDSCGGSGQVTCNRCGGAPLRACGACGGDGRVERKRRVIGVGPGAGSGYEIEIVRCGDCSGTGRRVCLACNRTGAKKCAKCRGSGLGACTACRGTRRISCPCVSSDDLPVGFAVGAKGKLGKLVEQGYRFTRQKVVYVPEVEAFVFSAPAACEATDVLLLDQDWEAFLERFGSEAKIGWADRKKRAASVERYLDAVFFRSYQVLAVAAAGDRYAVRGHRPEHWDPKSKYTTRGDDKDLILPAGDPPAINSVIQVPCRVIVDEGLLSQESPFERDEFLRWMRFEPMRPD